MLENYRSAPLRYGVAVLAIFVAALVRLWFDSVLGGSGFALLFAAVVIAAWYGGVGPSLVALTLSLAISVWLFRSEPEPAARVATGLAVFFFVGLVTALLSESMRAAQRRAEMMAEQAVRQREQLQATLAALGESEQRFARFMQHLPGLAWIKDRDGRYIYVNDAAEKAFNAPRAELYGKTDGDIFPHETAEQFQVNDRRALTAAAGEQAIETLAHADGVVHHSIVSKFPIPAASGEAALIGGMAIDITDRIRAEEALRDADRRKDEFLATLAHELRNPLAPISNAVQMLTLRPPGDPDVAAAYAIIDRQVRQMVRIIDDLLDVSRITSGRLQLRKERVELADMIRAAVETSRPTVDASRHRLTVALPGDPVYVDGDLTRLGQAFSNLLNNSAKYAEPGGRIEIEARCTAAQVEIAVRDEGIGISPEVLPYVFEMFRQGDRSLERSQGGLGVGLTLVRRVVELHGGSVEAHSAGAGQGSEFIVRLPIAEPPCESEPAGSAEEPLPKASPQRRVLVVDDNEDSAVTLGKMLQIMGSEVRMARDGLEAIDVASQFQPEIIFMDVGMPHLNGYDATRRIRTEPWGREIVIVALTGWGQQEDIRQSLAAGCTTHIVKPVDFAALGKLMSGAAPLRTA